MIEIRLKRSRIATTPNQKENLRGLGLFRYQQTVFRQDTASIRGMIQKVIHLVDIRKATASEAKRVVSSGNQLLEVIPPKEPQASKAKAPKKARAKKEKAS
jgi:large subunit ribosomal protein L30